MESKPTHPPECRYAGVMLALSSLPGRHGIGDMGKAAYAFVDLLAESGVHYWQLLPINPPGCGNSPYQPYSSFAGDPALIDLDDPTLSALLDTSASPFNENAICVDYDGVRVYKDYVLRKAFQSFIPHADFTAFAEQPLLKDYAVFMAFRRKHQEKNWMDWEKPFREWPKHRNLDLSPYEADIHYELFLQYLFFSQWKRLKAYANQKGIEMLGDIPFYVGQDSQDVWAGQANFLLDDKGQPSFIAGVPPDYFSPTGQRWGNPIYDWNYMQRDGFTFWLNRMESCKHLFDMVRIDHFRAFDTYWKIPVSCPTAEEGEWIEAPGYAFFNQLRESLPELNIIVEDLGYLRDEVLMLRDHFHFRGMKILEFSVEPWARIDFSKDKEQLVVYTGTHDNQTAQGWYSSMPWWKRLGIKNALRRKGYTRGTIAHKMVCLALDHPADMVVIPVQDILGLGDEARMNTPGTIGSPNWEWKLADLGALQAAMPAFAKSVKESYRVL